MTKQIKLLPAMAVVATGLLFGACDTNNTPLTYEGSSTIGMNIMPAASEKFAKETGAAFTSIGNEGSGAGFTAVMSGAVAIGGLSRELKEQEKSQRPYYRIIGYDAIGVFVHSTNPVSSLTKAQIRDIFAGKITNWKDVGGTDAPINVITEIKSGGRATIKVFKKIIMGETDFGNGTEIDKPVDCVRKVATDPNAITPAAIVFKQNSTKAINIDGVEPSGVNTQMGTYPLNRPLILISKVAPEGDAKKFFDFMMSPAGQKIVGDSGFFPVR